MDRAPILGSDGSGLESYPLIDVRFWGSYSTFLSFLCKIGRIIIPLGMDTVKIRLGITYLAYYIGST